MSGRLAVVASLTCGSSYPYQQWGIYVADPRDGSCEQPVAGDSILGSAGMVTTSDLAWSPDGTKLAFTYWPYVPGEVNMAPHIYISDLSSQVLPAPLPISTPNVSPDALDWSPDGTQLVIKGATYTPNQQSWTTAFRLYRINATAALLRR